MFGKNKKIDFLAIGDIVVDAFIKLKDAEELINHGTLELCVRFGDKVPYESVTVPMPLCPLLVWDSMSDW